jgi:dTDP-4-dehydrorhamnose reductase
LKTLVIGRTGQLAQALAEQGGANVTCIGRPGADLTDPSSLQATISRHRPDIVVNAAAYTAVDLAEREPDVAYAVNAGGARLLAKACTALGLPLIHISTDYVFNGTAHRPYREDDPTDPISAYGASKLAGEHAIIADCRRHLILRTSWLHSPWGNNFVRTMLRLAAIRREIGVVNDQIGAPTYAPDLAAAILIAAHYVANHPEHSPWGIYHVASAESTTWYGFACEIFRLAEQRGLPHSLVKPITTAEFHAPARRPANSQLDTAKFVRQFGHELPNWRDGAAACVQRLAQVTSA